MAEKKTHNIVESTAEGKKIKDAKPVGNATGLRIGAICLWVLAIAFEIVGIMIGLGKLTLTFMPTLAQLIIAIVLDLVCVIVGAQLWKKANHIKPASEKNQLTFWLWNNMGVIVCIIAFVPFVIVLLTNKNLDKKTKAIATVVAIIALLIGGLASYDFNPVSEEQQQAAITALDDTPVYWAPFGKVYHIDEDCGSLNQTDTITRGSVEQAIAEGRTRLCYYCDKRHTEIEGVVVEEE